MQVGVVPIVVNKKDVQVVLISARGQGQWLIPKGNQHRKHSKRQMALTEAYEEAGVIGTIRHKVYVDVPFRKAGKKKILRLYPMDVTRVLKKWPEKNLRARKIVGTAKAGEMLRCKKLRAGLTHLVKVGTA